MVVPAVLVDLVQLAQPVLAELGDWQQEVVEHPDRLVIVLLVMIL
jgi:hypothetical protein